MDIGQVSTALSLDKAGSQIQNTMLKKTFNLENIIMSELFSTLPNQNQNQTESFNPPQTGVNFSAKA